MVKASLVFSFVLIVLSIFSFAFILFSIGFYSSNLGVKLSGRSSSQANVGMFIETSTGYCGDSLCNSNETCSSCVGDCGECTFPSSSSTSSSSSGSTSSGGGGGGGGGSATATTKVSSFKISDPEINVKMVTGEVKDFELIIDNTGTAVLELDVVIIGLENYLAVDSRSIYILPGKNSSFNFSIVAPKPGVYPGKILFNYQGVTREVSILLNVVSKGVLFDLTVTVPELYKILRPSQTLPAFVEISELGGEKGTDVKITYVIKDFNGNVHYTESENLFVVGSKRYNKRFSTVGLEPKDYVLGIELEYVGGLASASAQFRISSSFLTPQTWVAIIILIMIILSIIFLIIFFKRRKKKEKEKLKYQKILQNTRVR